MKLQFSKEKFPGILISFCGLDGSGKTTQIELLESWLKQKGLALTKTFQPTNEVRKTKLFRQFMDSSNHEGLEYRSLSLITVSDRLQHSRSFILPKLMNSEVVISDRYYYCALANLLSRGYMGDKWIYEIANFIPKPDVSFFIDINFDVAVNRVRNRTNEKSESIDEEFNKKLNENSICIGKSNDGVLLNGNDTINEIHNEVVYHVNKVVKRKLISQQGGSE